MLKEKLKEALKKAGLNEGLADVINITSEDQIEGVVNSLQPQNPTLDFSAVLQSKEFATYVQQVGFDKVLEQSKTLQSEHDKKVTKGVETFKSKFLKTLTPDDGQGGNEPKPNQGDDVPAWAKQLMDTVSNLSQEKARATKLEQAQAVISKSKLPEKFQKKWINRIDLESETPFEEQIKGLEEEYTDLQKDFVGANARRGLPSGGISDTTVTDEQAEAIVDEM
ncbi:MAG: hypothetical protein KGV59_05460 [Tenacibaculum sp.]|nr:hypothetical protein [Tenacibaculum sp.]